MGLCLLRQRAGQQGLTRIAERGAAEALEEAGVAAEGALESGACFVAGTPVQMVDGTTKPIEEVKAGDLVWSRNEATGQVQAHRVLKTFQRESTETLSLAFAGGETLTTTPEHPFWVEGRGWRPAQELGLGTSIVTRAGPSLAVAGITRHPGKPTTVYNREVEGTHSYFVGRLGGGLCVHNRCTEIAEAFQKDLGGEIWQLRHPEPNMRLVPRDGRHLGWLYHDVHVLGGVVRDPMLLGKGGMLPVDEWLGQWMPYGYVFGPK